MTSQMTNGFKNTPGWATDLKTVPAEMINSRVKRTGDGTHRNQIMLRSKESLNQTDDNQDTTSFWGYGDKEMTEDDMKNILIIQKQRIIK